MLDRKYFEEVLPEQIGLMEQPVRLTLHLTTGDEYIVHSVVAGHDAYAVFAVHGKGKAHEHTKGWQRANPKLDPVIYDQVCIPYEYIAVAHLTASTTKGD